MRLARRPAGAARLDDFAIVEAEVPEPERDEVQVIAVLVSVDPYMRLLMDRDLPIGAPIVGGGIGRVVRSRTPALREGDLVRHSGGLRERFNAKVSDVTRVEPDPDLPLSVYLHALGGTGLTAYGGLLGTGALRDGEEVFVSAAAGAVGSVAAQIARLKGCYVVGSAGSADKAAWLRDEARLDAVINYREQPIEEALAAVTPRGIDVYFDNVGGAHLDAALLRMNDFGRIPVCGMISTYDGGGEPVRRLNRLMYGRIRLEGFLIRDLAPLEARFAAEMTDWLRTGQIRWRETVVEGFERTPEALLGLFAGRNFGKMLVRAC